MALLKVDRGAVHEANREQVDDDAHQHQRPRERSDAPHRGADHETQLPEAAHDPDDAQDADHAKATNQPGVRQAEAALLLQVRTPLLRDGIHRQQEVKDVPPPAVVRKEEPASLGHQSHQHLHHKDSDEGLVHDADPFLGLDPGSGQGIADADVRLEANEDGVCSDDEAAEQVECVAVNEPLEPGPRKLPPLVQRPLRALPAQGLQVAPQPEEPRDSVGQVRLPVDVAHASGDLLPHFVPPLVPLLVILLRRLASEGAIGGEVDGEPRSRTPRRDQAPDAALAIDGLESAASAGSAAIVALVGHLRIFVQAEVAARRATCLTAARHGRPRDPGSPVHRRCGRPHSSSRQPQVDDIRSGGSPWSDRRRNLSGCRWSRRLVSIHAHELAGRGAGWAGLRRPAPGHLP
mmetsp:Transcript_36949/g.106174  ORF Transcript_36949/g.106174 Transcript_36949/m.106174 type:complete len:405 (-) Transcript_36949:99-1313(-)